MFLMDWLNQLAALANGNLDHAEERLRHLHEPRKILTVFAGFKQRLEGTPRFLLDEAATRTMAELTLGRPKIMREAMANLHIPYPKLWVEWPEAARERLREAFKTDNFVMPGRPIPQRVGFLLECNPGGRSGRVTWVWIAKELNFPNIAPIECRFDLDRSFPARLEGDISAMTNNLAMMWQDSQMQYEAFKSIWRTSEHVPSEDWGEAYMHDAKEWEIKNCIADVYGEYITVWAAMLLLTANRPVVDLVPIDMGRLNKQRIKKKALPLLDYTSVTMKLTPPDPQYNPVLRGPLGHARKSPRVHMVSSYLARRGNLHWIVQPYMRGKGATIHRVTHVKG